MRCPICSDETAGQDTQQWGPEWAHVRCVKAYSLGGVDARADMREKLERLAAEGESLKLAMREVVIADDSGALEQTHIEACRELLENPHG